MTWFRVVVLALLVILAAETSALVFLALQPDDQADRIERHLDGIRCYLNGPPGCKSDQ